MYTAHESEKGKWAGSAEVQVGGRASLEIRLGRGLTIEGIVIDGEDRHGVPAATVVGSGAGWRAVVKADASGRFVLWGCPPDAEILVRANAATGARASLKGVKPGAVDLVLDLSGSGGATCRLWGTAMDALGRPAVNGLIHLKNEQGDVRTVHDVDGATGAFALKVSPGKYKVTLSSIASPSQSVTDFGCEASTDWMEVVDGEDRWAGDLVMPLGGRVRVRLSVAASAFLRLETVTKPVRTYYAETDRAGLCMFEAVPTGRYEIAPHSVKNQAGAPALVEFRRSVEVAPARIEEVDIAVEWGTLCRLAFRGIGLPDSRVTTFVEAPSIGVRRAMVSSGVGPASIDMALRLGASEFRVCQGDSVFSGTALILTGVSEYEIEMARVK